MLCYIGDLFFHRAIYGNGWSLMGHTTCIRIQPFLEVETVTTMVDSMVGF